MPRRPACGGYGLGWEVAGPLSAKALDVVGVQPNGLCEIPWSIGSAKHAFKDFATILAASIPGAIAYETPKTWTVSKPGKGRINILELLDAAPALWQALDALHSSQMGGS